MNFSRSPLIKLLISLAVSAVLPSQAQGDLQRINSVPQTVLDTVRAAPMRSLDSLAGFRILEDQVLRVENLTINALSNTRFRISSVPPRYPFYVIAARTINIEVPADRRDAARISFLVQTPSLNATDGAGGTPGADQGGDTGAHGGNGGPGGTGGTGRTLDLPPIYVIYQNVFVSGGTPNASLALGFDLHGVRGGDGGRGGLGGRAGNGATGTSSSCTTGYIPITGPYCFCDSGPGIGGNAGVRGSGGRGGDAGRGGNGGTVNFAGPPGPNDSYLRVITGFVEVLQPGGDAGSPAGPGEQGSAGGPGGGGYKCTCCNGRRGGDSSPNASPINFGPGSPAPGGQRGLQSYSARDNSDLF
jgi:hypothetical protein